MARRVMEGLENRGVRCWLDESVIPVGEPFVSQLGRALNEAQAFLLIDTPASRNSYWVQRELACARRHRADGVHHPMLRVCGARTDAVATGDWDGTYWARRFPYRWVGRLLRRRARGFRPSIVEADARQSQPDELTGTQPANWVGRQDEFRRLDAWFRKGEGSLWLHGGAGQGKSGLVRTLLVALLSLGYEKHELIAIHCLNPRSLGDPESAELELNSWVTRTTETKKILFVDGYEEIHANGSADSQGQARSRCMGGYAHKWRTGFGLALGLTGDRHEVPWLTVNPSTFLSLSLEWNALIGESGISCADS